MYNLRVRFKIYRQIVIKTFLRINAQSVYFPHEPQFAVTKQKKQPPVRHFNHCKCVVLVRNTAGVQVRTVLYTEVRLWKSQSLEYGALLYVYE